MPPAKLCRLAEQLPGLSTTIPLKRVYEFTKRRNIMKESTKELKGRVGEVVSRNISGKKTDWERSGLGTVPEKSRTHGDTLVNPNAKTSDHTPTLTAFESNSGHDPRV